MTPEHGLSFRRGGKAGTVIATTSALGTDIPIHIHFVEPKPTTFTIEASGMSQMKFGNVIYLLGNGELLGKDQEIDKLEGKYIPSDSGKDSLGKILLRACDESTPTHHFFTDFTVVVLLTDKLRNVSWHSQYFA